MKPKACVLRTDGTNCDEETAHALQKAGGAPELVHVNQIRSGQRKLKDYQILVIPGGFTYGDDVAAGRILAIELTSCLRDTLREFAESDTLMLGICNGFQVLVQVGLLPFRRLGLGEAAVTLTANNSGRFECRWVKMAAEGSHCVFTQGITGVIELPAAHGEGKFFTDTATIDAIEKDHLVVLRYVERGTPTMRYPANPNGSLHSIAGMCDPTGRILGLMPHPERYAEATQHPNWRRLKGRQPAGLQIFTSAIDYFST